MRIFLSYAFQDREAARTIERALTEEGHDVFFDRDDLPVGEEYHTRIRRAIEQADLLIFLISPDAVDPGSYTLSEIEIAEKAWRRASGRLLPVMLRPTPDDSIPPFVLSVTYLLTPGNVTATVAAEVHRIDAGRTRQRRTMVAVTLATVALVGFATWLSLDGSPSTEITGRDGAPAVMVPGGMFTMGDDEESPMREIHVDAFYIDRFEVTTRRYAEFLTASSANPPDDWESLALPAGAELPVVGVDWNDADAYCAWAGKRLPTEAEWEKAARGTDARRFPWGDASPTTDLANYENASPLAYEGGLMAVGSHPAGDSPFGVSDMAGNASEWVADWYSESFPSDAVDNPKGPETGEARVVRGGGRFEPGERLTAVKRFYAPPEARSEDLGFRCALDAQ